MHFFFFFFFNFFLVHRDCQNQKLKFQVFKQVSVQVPVRAPLYNGGSRPNSNTILKKTTFGRQTGLNLSKINLTQDSRKITTCYTTNYNNNPRLKVIRIFILPYVQNHNNTENRNGQQNKKQKKNKISNDHTFPLAVSGLRNPCPCQKPTASR